MRRMTVIAVALLVGGATPAPAADGAAESSTRVAYVANEGFLVKVGDTAVLVDALFGPRPLSFADVPGTRSLEKLQKGEPPFDRVRVALVTHRHVDHFDAKVAVAFLRSRPHTDLVGPPQVIEDLQATPGSEAVVARLHAAPAAAGSDTTLAFGPVTVRALGIPHGPYMVEDPVTGRTVNRHLNTQNLAYAVTVGSFRFFHNGDANLLAADEYCRFHLNPPGVDVAFLGGLLWPPVEAGVETMGRCLAPLRVVPMHLYGDQKAGTEARLRALEERLPPFVIPGAPMTELALPATAGVSKP